MFFPLDRFSPFGQAAGTTGGGGGRSRFGAERSGAGDVGRGGWRVKGVNPKGE